MPRDATQLIELFCIPRRARQLCWLSDCDHYTYCLELVGSMGTITPPLPLQFSLHLAKHMHPEKLSGLEYP